MQGTDLANWAMKPIAVAALVAGLVLPLPARAETAAPACDAPLDLLRLANPLSRVAHKIATREPITIVAIGSSSTAGAGASSPAASYPNRLAVELKQHFPNHAITVLNRGVNGEEIGDMLKRFDSAVVAAKPDLVLWQLGTNSVIRDHKLADHDSSIRDGLKKIRAIGADVVLIDPQFAPKVIAKPEAAAHGRADRHHREAGRCRSVPPLRRDEALARGRSHGVRDVRVARRAAHERLELCLHGQGPWAGHRRSRAAAGHVGDGHVADSVPERPPPFSHLIQRRQQILDQVVGVLEAGREPHQPVADAELGALRRASDADASSWSDA